MMKQRKKLTAAILSLAVTCASVSAGIVASAANYPDTEGHWAETQVDYWSSQKVLSGYEDGNFKPDDTITRAEILTVLTKLIGLEDKAENKFTDLNASEWYADAILKAAAAGIVNGDENGNVNAASPATREQTAALFVRSFGVSEDASAVSQYSDSSDVSAWANGAVGGITAAGYMQGAENKFRPLDTITRAEFVALLDQTIAGYITEPGTYTEENFPAGEKGVIIIASPDVVLNGVSADYAIVSPLAAGGVEILNSSIANGVTNLSGVEITVDESVAVVGTELIKPTEVPAENDDPNATAAPEESDDPATTPKVTKKPSTGSSSGGGGGSSSSSTKYSVTLNANGGVFSGNSETAVVRVSKNSTLKSVTVTEPTREGYTFTGWYTDAEAKTEYDLNAAVTSALTIYAGWEAVEVDSTEAPAETVNPAATENPAATQAPAVTAAPNATQAPAATADPNATAAPIATTDPNATAAPIATADPNATAAPIATADPNATAAPIATADPNATAAPIATADPNATAAPIATADPNATAAPIATADPNATAAPIATADPNATAAPIATENPNATAAPTAEPVSEADFNLDFEQNATVLGKAPADLQENVKAVVDEETNTVKFTGYLKYVTDYTGFSSNTDEQTGNYVTFRMAVPKDVTVPTDTDAVVAKLISTDGTKETPVKVANLDESGAALHIVYILTDETKARGNAGIKVDWDADGEEYVETTYKFDFSDLVLVGENQTLSAAVFSADMTGVTSTQLWGKDVSDLQENVTAVTEGNTIKLTGTLKRQDSYEGFWGTALDAQYGPGYYVTYKFTKPNDLSYDSIPADETIVTWKKAQLGEDKPLTKAQVFEDDHETVIFIAKVSTDKTATPKEIEIDWDGTGTAYVPVTYTIDYTGLEFEASTPTP